MLHCHIIGFTAGFLLDLLFGDPHFMPHPVRGMGRLIERLEAWLLPEQNRLSDQEKLMRGGILVFCMLFATAAAVLLILWAAYRLHPAVGVLTESMMTYQALAVKCLKDESMKVYRELKRQNCQRAREAVSMIVGRDTKELDEKGIARAAVETVAENCSDGVIAPMLYLALGGPVLGFVYKAVNTMDSMLGYRNERYLYFGRAAARLDDAVNFIPARISAVFMIFAAFLPGKDFNGRGAVHIFRRDRKKHASPNSAQTESVCAGALGIRLAGDAVYGGRKVVKPFLGDPLREIGYEDIVRANKLLYRTALLCQGSCLCLLLLWGRILG